MYSNFKEQAIEYVKQAVQEDNAGNYVKAFPLYMNALEYFRTHLKYEKNPKIKEAITQKFTEYLRRAEEIRSVLDDGGGSAPAADGDAAVAARPKTKPKDGERGGDDTDQAKLRAGLTSAIITEKPNVKWNDVAGLESAKQALQEAVILPVKFPQFFTERTLKSLKHLHALNVRIKSEKDLDVASTVCLHPHMEVTIGRALASNASLHPYMEVTVGRALASNITLHPNMEVTIGRANPHRLAQMIQWCICGVDSQWVRKPSSLGKRRPWRAFLLYGPPGTGKSYLAKAVATEAESTFFRLISIHKIFLITWLWLMLLNSQLAVSILLVKAFSLSLLERDPHGYVGCLFQVLQIRKHIASISSSDLVSKWMGESEKLVANLFQMARENAPSIIFVDEIDSLCGQRGEGNESEASRRIKTELLVQMQGVGNNDQKVLVLAATNTPYALDQAIRRRFDKRIYIPLPDVKARQHMFKVHLGDTPHNLRESDFEYLAHHTEGFSGSDIAVCVKDVLFEPVRKAQDAMHFYKTSNGMWLPCEPRHPGAIQTTLQDLAAEGLADKILPPPIARADFDKVLARQRPTVSKADLEVHERFTKEFGEEG
ncbi:hypothetical protein ZIOFF_014110 [Zingiber officinale]|uniref:Uncharacterized protein n=2 Tax=Mesangiospermae TaxID=1437183 RepID=A0A8J5LDF8_ZINOF|nr:hypothetical protein ZIOFF_014110 [Zingiber officinale]